MASENLEIEVIVNGKKAITTLKGVENATDKVGKQTKKTDSEIKKSSDSIKTNWLAVGAAVAGVAASLKGVTDAYGVQLKAETALSGALKANAVQGQKTLGMWKAYASSLQDVTLYGDEATIQQVAMLKSMGLTDEQIQKTIEASMNLSAVTGQELESSVRNLAKTYSGMAGELGESIPKMRELTEEQMRAGEGIALVSQMYEGQAEAIAKTDLGALTQSWGLLADSMERVGDVALTIANDLNLPGAIEALADIVNDVTMKFFEAKVGVLSFDKAIAEFFGNTEDAKKYQEEIDKTIEKVLQLQGSMAASGEGIVPTTIPGVAVSGKKLETKDEAKAREKHEKEALKAAQEFEKLKIDMQRAWNNARYEEENQLQEQITEMQRLHNERRFLEGKEATEKAEKAKQEEYEETRKKMEVISGKIADSIIASAMAGKASFADMAQAMIMEMVRVYMQKFILQAAMSFIPGGSLLGGLFHTGGEVKHTGGTIGGNLPTYHSGMRSDERAAKLQVGEAVINRAGARNNAEAIDAMNAGYKVGGGGGDVTTAEINFNVQAIDAASFNSYLVNNRGTIEGIINRSIQTNGSVRKTIKQVG